MLEEQIIRVLAAAAAGGLIGLEREYHDKSAGFRTMILISTGAALFTIFADVIGGPDADSARIASSVVSGVGFLGAGVIIKDGVNIRGLTTAATIWLAAALGMGMGAGQYELVMMTTGLSLAVLWLLPAIERKIDNLHEFVEYHVVVNNSDKEEAAVMDIFELHAVKVVHVGRTRSNSSERELHLKSMGNPIEHTRLDRDLANSKHVVSFQH